MDQESRIATVREIMAGFAEQTGLTSTANPPRRYLWTDAHAVCNFLSLFRATGEEQYRDLAEALIEQVHELLGKHRADDSRRGWISGLGEAEGRQHPTAGGLRIGKKLQERGRNDVVDERLEWDRDGQYFHYLTKWMHALCRTSAVTGEARYCRWAVELAKVAQAKFTAASPTGRKRLLWKMSIDLSYPLVPSSGLHDSLDAYITYNELGQCPAASPGLPGLDAELAATAMMIEGGHWHTDDPLGLGGLLFDAGRVIQLVAAGQMMNTGLASALLRTSTESLEAFVRQVPLIQPARYRLAFRELGLSIGLHAIARMRESVAAQPGIFGQSFADALHELEKYAPVSELLESFWLAPGNQQADTWLDHLDINRVMLATSLLPDVFLGSSCHSGAAEAVHEVLQRRVGPHAD